MVLDTKLKVLDQNKSNGSDKYGLSQADFYQMFAYGQNYLAGKGNVFLLSPQTEKFTKAIKSSFCYNPNPNVNEEDKLHPWIVAVDLSEGTVDAPRIIWPDLSSSITAFLKI